jgi:RNA polymerase sigma-70 factor, ECF subfamily
MDMGTAGTNVMAGVAASTLSDAEVVRRVRGGEAALFEILMRRHNQRLYRAARAIVKDEGEVEDVMQQAYINAYTHLHQFEERSLFSTWMMRITLNEAFARRRKLLQSASVADAPRGLDPERGAPMDTMTSPQPDPERQAYAAELRRLLEDAVDALPEAYRAVFMLRDVEGLSTAETGDGLGLGEEAVKTRLHRARAMIRRSVAARVGSAAAGAFAFPATRCDRVVAGVLAVILPPQ